MTIIRQGSLFDLQDLYDLEPTQRFEAILSAIDINPILVVLGRHHVLAGLLKNCTRATFWRNIHTKRF